MEKGQQVKIRGRRGWWIIDRPFTTSTGEAGWWVFDPDQRRHAIRADEIRRK
jgi:hypothetical protein